MMIHQVDGNLSILTQLHNTILYAFETGIGYILKKYEQHIKKAPVRRRIEKEQGLEQMLKLLFVYIQTIPGILSIVVNTYF
jgi:hypothetical protein